MKTTHSSKHNRKAGIGGGYVLLLGLGLLALVGAMRVTGWPLAPQSSRLLVQESGGPDVIAAIAWYDSLAGVFQRDERPPPRLVPGPDGQLPERAPGATAPGGFTRSGLPSPQELKAIGMYHAALRVRAPPVES